MLRSIVGLAWCTKWIENWKMHSKFSIWDHGLRICCLGDLLCSENWWKLHLEWLHDPPTQLHGIPTKGGKGITAGNFVNELVAQRNIRMINYNRLHTEFSIHRVWNIFVPLRFFDYVLLFLDHPLSLLVHYSLTPFFSPPTFCSTFFYRTICLLLYSLPLLLFYLI